jgi:outer membrane protein assembly factor BamB
MEGESARAGRLGREQKLALIVIGALLVVAGVIAIVVSVASSDEDTSAPAPESAYPNVDPSNTRHLGGPIDAATVSRLEAAWTLPLNAQGQNGAAWSTPIVANGVAYIQDLASNVQAIELSSGKVLWERQYNSPTEGPNGLTISGDRVFGATTTSAFALSRKSGEELWSVPLTKRGETIDMAPGYNDGLVYVSTIPSALTGGEVGTLWALDAKTGKKTWSFATAPKALWGHPEINYGGGLWQSPAFDEGGSIYFGVANPGPLAGTSSYPWGKSRPGPNLYTNSIVKLDAKTGKLDWYYQLTPHALCDWDLQGPPVLLDAGGRELVVIAGKGGIVIALDRNSGKLVWKRVVGAHNGHDQDGLRAMSGDYSNLKIPQTVYPGTLGGVMSPPSTDGSLVFVPVVNHPTTLVAQSESKEGTSKKGELVAIDAASGSIAWKHEFSSAPIGATSAVNELVFASTLDGTLYAFDGQSGKQVWESSLPAGMIAGMAFSGDTMLAPAGIVAGREQSPQLVAYRLGA